MAPAFIHLFDIERDHADCVANGFPVIRRRNGAAHGEYRTKRVILET